MLECDSDPPAEGIVVEVADEEGVADVDVEPDSVPEDVLVVTSAESPNNGDSMRYGVEYGGGPTVTGPRPNSP